MYSVEIKWEIPFCMRKRSETYTFLCKCVPVDIHLMTLSVNEYNWTYYKGISLSYDLKQLIVSFLLDNGADPTTSAIP